MVQQYVFVRMPKRVYDRYKNIQRQICLDLRSISGKDIKMPMTKVFDVVVNHNENYIQLDLKKLLRRFK